MGLAQLPTAPWNLGFLCSGHRLGCRAPHGVSAVGVTNLESPQASPPSSQRPDWFLKGLGTTGNEYTQQEDGCL